MTVRAFAHRGGALHPDLIGHENTLRAFLHAVDLGYRHLETDVHLTRDGALVAFHDAVLDRVTNSTGQISALTSHEVAQARIGGSEPIPTLAELVAAVPSDVRFNIDLKARGTAPALARFLQEHGLEQRVMVGSFSSRELREFRRVSQGRVATSAHPAEIAAYLLSPRRRWLRRLAPRALQIPYRHRGLRVTSPRIISRAHAHGLEVHVWTIDEPAEMHYLLDIGVDGLMTDRTDLLKDVLISRGQWRGPGEEA